MYGKRGVHKDTKLQDEGGQILDEDGILYNCAFSVTDAGRQVNEYGLVFFFHFSCYVYAPTYTV